MNNEVCIHCGGTGITFQNKKCDCGATGKEDKTSPKDIYIPKLYQDIRELGKHIVVRNQQDCTIDFIVDKYIDNPRNHPSMVLDISSTDLGAYQVYYSLIGRLIEKYDKIPDGLKNFILVNKVTADDINKLENSTREGDWKPLLLITDYSVNSKEYEEMMKIIPFRGYGRVNPYPINVYHVKFISKY